MEDELQAEEGEGEMNQREYGQCLEMLGRADSPELSPGGGELQARGAGWVRAMEGLEGQAAELSLHLVGARCHWTCLFVHGWAFIIPCAGRCAWCSALDRPGAGSVNTQVGRASLRGGLSRHLTGRTWQPSHLGGDVLAEGTPK